MPSSLIFSLSLCAPLAFKNGKNKTIGKEVFSILYLYIVINMQKQNFNFYGSGPDEVIGSLQEAKYYYISIL